MRERVIEQKLRTEVTEQLGNECVKLDAGGGWPDRLVVLPGEVIFVETKKPSGGVVSAEQVANHNKLARLGYPVEILSTMKAVAEFIKERKQP